MNHLLRLRISIHVVRSKHLTATIKSMRYLLFVLLIVSCKPDPESWRSRWVNENLKLKRVAALLKQNRLNLINPRGIYQIPDSIDLKEPYGQLVYRQTDFTYDSSYSIVFYPTETSKDKVKFMFVYTDNVKRLSEYESRRKSVVKIEDNWYCVDNSYSFENIIRN